MRTALYSLILVLFFNSCNEEYTTNDYPKYYHLVREAKILSSQQKSNLALDKFEEAKKAVDYVHNNNLIWAAAEAKKTGNCQLTIEYLTIAVRQGFNNPTNLSNEEFLTTYLKCKESHEEIKEELLIHLNDPKRKINYRFKLIIDSLYFEDQNVRTSNSDDIYQTDSSNIALLRSLIVEFGFPDERVVGSETAEKAFYIILHYDNDINNEIMGNVLEKALKEGKIHPKNYAWIVDRRLFWGPGRQEPYYYQIPSRSLQRLTVKELKEIDNRRYNIGLKPISEMNIIFSDDGSITVSEDWTDN